MLAKLGLQELPKKSVLLIEEDVGSVKQIFVQRVGNEAATAGKSVVYVTPKLGEDITRQMAAYGLQPPATFAIIEQFRDTGSLLEVCRADICIVDPFTAFFVDGELNELVNVLESFIMASRTENMVFLLTADMGVIPARAEAVMRSMADGIIQFITVHSSDRIHRYINIPKLNGTAPFDRMIPFTIAAAGIAIDTRERIA